jgi:hypothetical protein
MDEQARAPEPSPEIFEYNHTGTSNMFSHLAFSDPHSPYNCKYFGPYIPQGYYPPPSLYPDDWNTMSYRPESEDVQMTDGTLSEQLLSNTSVASEGDLLAEHFQSSSTSDSHANTSLSVNSFQPITQSPFPLDFSLKLGLELPSSNPPRSSSDSDLYSNNDEPPVPPRQLNTPDQPFHGEFGANSRTVDDRSYVTTLSLAAASINPGPLARSLGSEAHAPSTLAASSANYLRRRKEYVFENHSGESMHKGCKPQFSSKAVERRPVSFLQHESGSEQLFFSINRAAPKLMDSFGSKRRSRRGKVSASPTC